VTRTFTNTTGRGFQRRRGVAIVELALVLPILLVLLLGIWEVGRLVQISQIVNNAAREGARKASTGINTYSDVSTTVTNYLTTAGITNLSGLQVQVFNVTQGNAGPSYDPSKATQLDQLKVIVSLPLSNVQWALVNMLITDPNTQITATAVWLSNQDLAYPTNITPPAGS
jgi:Flp pilus assembly protein TadG